MKEVYNKKFKAYESHPETCLESVEQLEEFLCADFGARDWSPKFLKRSFKICKDEIKKFHKRGKR